MLLILLSLSQGAFASPPQTYLQPNQGTAIWETGRALLRLIDPDKPGPAHAIGLHCTVENGVALTDCPYLELVVERTDGLQSVRGKYHGEGGYVFDELRTGASYTLVSRSKGWTLKTPVTLQPSREIQTAVLVRAPADTVVKKP